LLLGAAGGVGSLAIGVAKRLGAHVTAVVSTYAVDHVRGLGADEVIDRTTQDPLTVAGPFDVVFDIAAASSYAKTRHLLSTTGAYVTTLPSAGFVAGKLLTAFSKRRCAFLTVKSTRGDLEQLATWLDGGMAVPIEARFPVRDLRKALDHLAAGKLKGRIAIDVENGF
jgi:NADPH:quinone reductase